MRDISLRQRVIASNLPVNLCLLVGQAVGLTLLFRSLEPSLESLRDPWFITLAVFSLFATVVLSFFGAAIVGLAVFGSLMDDQERRNGGPFAVGDRVQILAGRYAGQIGTVAHFGQGQTVCVKISSLDKDADVGVYSHYQLLREQSDEPNVGPEKTQSP
jgi:hypothetical protein